MHRSCPASYGTRPGYVAGTASGKAWLIAGVAAVAVTAGVAAWLYFRRADDEPVPFDVQRTGGADPDAPAASTEAQP